ncbi:hypothetical protein [Actinoplanes siamensis]|uniref:Uncharacterized protein n=1 Tax=Actinoplanes siamensis TaxID=1223317 RepID=A0A919NEH4_9ACTN|nr:hypothetical protein [Actinoplanes siamensis]GIF09799.1 hypothetical protein Asi03nite_73370 [Actinoplanes siamensis]
MSSSSPALQGLVSNAGAGYRLAAKYRRQLLTVVLPVLAPTLIGLALVDLLLGREHASITNSVLVIDGSDGGTPSWARLGLIATFWLLALPAATLALIGAKRGHTVRPLKAIVAAVRYLPALAVGVCAAAVLAFALLWMAAALAGAAGGGLPGVVLVVGALAVAGVLAARILISVLSRLIGGPGGAVTAGPVAGTAGAFLLGGVAVPLVLAHLADRIGGAARVPVVGQTIDAVLLIALIAMQAGILAYVCLQRRDATGTGEQEPARPAVDDARLSALAGRPMRLPGLAIVAAATAIAVLTPWGIAAANPFGAPTVRSHPDAPDGVAAIAWPAGKHPVMATIDGARFCDNDVCDSYVAHNGTPLVIDGRGDASISADGATVVSATLGGGENNGGPFINYGRCTRAGCSQAWLPARASAKEPVAWPELAVAIAPDQAIWFVLATPSADDRAGKATYRIRFIRCAKVGCPQPQRFDGGTMERIVEDSAEYRQRARLTIGADGRPLATIRTGVEAALITCDPVTCAHARSTWVFAGEPGRTWVAPATSTEPLVTFQPDALRIGEQLVPLSSNDVPSWSGALAVAGGRVYATAAEPATTRRQGLHITIGTDVVPEQPDRWQQVLWRCDQSHCQRQVMDSFDSVYAGEALAVSPDGRVLVVRTDRILLVSAS